jgi:prolipoprotein diacylglyceryl transferase
VPKFTWDIDPALFKIPVPLIGTLEIRYYSLIFVLVFLGGYALLNWQIRRGGGDEEEAGDFIIYGVLGVLLGARLGHVLFYDLDKALRDPSWVFKIWTGGLASHGAVIGLIVAMYLFTKRRGVPFLEGADRFAFSAALGASLVRVGNFFNSEIVGKPTDQTWGVQFPRFDGEGGPFRHPSQLYEATMGFAILGILFLLDKRLGKEERPRGALISVFFVLYFVGRFCVEFVKEYQESIVEADSILTMGQWLSIPGFLLGVYGLYWSFRHRLPAGWADLDHLDSDDEEQEAAEQAEDDEAEQDEAAEDDSSVRRKGYDPDVEAEFGSKRKEQDEPPAVARPRKKKRRKKAKRKREQATDEPSALEGTDKSEAED